MQFFTIYFTKKCQSFREQQSTSVVQISMKSREISEKLDNNNLIHKRLHFYLQLNINAKI